MTALDRARLSLLGLAIGDAFGETMFGDPDRSARRTVARELSTRRPWPWTDDTAMALSIVEVLARHGTIDVDALADAFLRRWSAEPNRGYGQGAYTLFHRIALGASWRVEVTALFGGQGSYGNGAAMRATPIGAYFAGDLARVRAEALRSAEPTHAHPEGAAGGVAVAIACALACARIDRASLLAETAAWTPEGRTRDGLRRAAALGLDAEPEDVGEAVGTGREVAAHDTVPFAVWAAARHLDHYEDALWTATSQVGDRDTVGAITGGIVVMAAGEASIPAAWRDAMEPLPDPVSAGAAAPPTRT